MDISYIDRKTGEVKKEKVYGRRILSFFYGDSYFSRFFFSTLLPLLSLTSWGSALYGFFQKTKRSARKIKPFIQMYEIDTSEFATMQFDSFNDFFIRKLRSEARPIVADPKVATLPADGRYFVFPDVGEIENFYVKGQKFDLATFLQDGCLARRLERGSMMMARLCPTDYHRFHFPMSGIPACSSLIEGSLFSVNPFALRKKLSILFENKRMITEIETELFGTVFYVEIGAACVGTIHQTYTPGKPVKKGDEKGYFSFGGSALILLFEKDKILFDEDLIRNSKNGLETLAHFGGSMGIYPS